ncbi:acetyl-CoA carboxylase biotin carboxyl carrier protein subunit, partial [Xanthovirga aplysinae]|uniref:acetyl-CoA carboxylase biotin carboxyl carrier protein subunit n=1 Tax=Xanthovirga aplysinae TaxID=2529853 RepID=UPI0012BBE892
KHNYHIIKDNKSYKAELVNADKNTKSFLFKINGEQIEVNVKDRFDLLLEKLGMNEAAGSKVHELKAPMPGLILDILVKEGEELQKGDPILILEAMKMENIIKSPGNVEIKSIKAKKGESVEKNQLLVEF